MCVNITIDISFFFILETKNFLNYISGGRKYGKIEHKLHLNIFATPMSEK